MTNPRNFVNTLLSSLKKTDLRAIFVYLFVFIFCLYISKDPDLGWHLKYGEYFFQNHQILRDNIFSVEMPDYKYINSAWMTDLLTYLFFKAGGFYAVSILSSAVFTLTFYFFSKAAKLNLFHQVFIFPLLLLFEAPIIRNSFRGQDLSYLGIGILFYLLSKNDKKALLLLPPLFLIWVNFHGQFILGLGLFLIWILLKIISKNSYNLNFLAIIFLTSVSFTFVNPFGVDIYREVFKHASNSSAQYINEWMAVDDYSLMWWYLYVWLFLISTSSLKLIYQKKLPQYFFYIFICFGLLFISFEMRRYIWVTLLVSIPLIKSLFDFAQKRLFIKNILINIMLILGIIYLSFIKIPDLNSVEMNWDSYCNFIRCSDKSAEFLQSYSNYSHLFSDYGWGGWLIWNYPKIKPLIDGRMAFWEDKTGYNALNNYIQFENNSKDINESKYDVVYIPAVKPIFIRMVELTNEGKWELLYNDKKAFIFVRKEL